jgi:hypothetical protein
MASQTPFDSSPYEFWIRFAGVIATFLAVLVALFGEVARKKFFAPKLRLRFDDPKGEGTTVRLTRTDAVIPQQKDLKARFYHLLVTNGRRWSPATQVQVLLLGVEEPRADGQFTPVWSGDIPVGWKNQEFFPPSRTLGPNSYIDLCSVREDGTFQLYPLFQPNNLRRVWKSERVRLRLSFQARSNESDSNVLRLEINWDGLWEDGAEEMRRHLIVTPLL